MPAASGPTDDHAIAILGEVELNSLKVTPGTIVPFEAAEISWNVSGPAGFSVLLENTTVARIGERLVTPLSTRAFRLKARAGSRTQVLGTVTVTVDQAACRIVAIPNIIIEQQVRMRIDQMLAETPGATRRRDDVLDVDQSGIHIGLALKQEVSTFPDAHMDIQATWQYRGSNGQLVEDFTQLIAKASFPWYQSWVWLIPGAHPGITVKLALAERDARDRVRAKAAEGAEDLEDFVGFVLRIVSAQFTPTNFEVFGCPDAALRRLLLPGAPALHATPNP